MKELIEELKTNLKEYKMLSASLERSPSLNYEQTEDLGAYLGKTEILEMIIPRLEGLI